MSNGAPNGQAAGASGRALVIHPHLKSAVTGERTPAARLAEASGLARAIALDVVAAVLAPVGKPRPATLLGAGQAQGLAETVAEHGIDVVIVDGTLSPKQQQNLEKLWNCKVIDRTGLILEIFGQRARTAEGRLQVGLARLTYQRGRLVRTWTHLERQRGGLGAVGGPGESQLEADRRMIDQQIISIKRRLDGVSRTRELHRKRRRDAPWPVVALVGYTNAGKSTLFNRLTASEVYAEALLFATLDPTMRAIDLPSGRRIVLSDTVGFVSELPTDLIAAFRATLEEVLEADLILHVRDIAHPDSEAERRDVERVLDDLGLEQASRNNVVQVLNKIDLLDETDRVALLNGGGRGGQRVAVSAATGQGLEALIELIDSRFAIDREILEVTLEQADGANLAWLYRHGEILERRESEATVELKVGLDAADLGRWRKRQ